MGNCPYASTCSQLSLLSLKNILLLLLTPSSNHYPQNPLSKSAIFLVWRELQFFVLYNIHQKKKSRWYSDLDQDYSTLLSIFFFSRETNRRWINREVIKCHEDLDISKSLHALKVKKKKRKNNISDFIKKKMNI